MFEYRFPIAGPITRIKAITTIATKTRMNAYSTSPCPFSGRRNFIQNTSFLLARG
jgi:hypothetical protein